MSEKRPPRRIALTQKDAATEVGLKLLKVLEKVVAEGEISDREIVALRNWLDKAATVSELPGIHFLREEIADILADGKVSEAETRLLTSFVLRVLPPIEREKAKAKVGEAKAEEKARAKALERRERAAEAIRPTDRQLEFLKELGGALPPGATRQQASDLIDRLLAMKPTPRQRMVLRFWNRLFSVKRIKTVLNPKPAPWPFQGEKSDPRIRPSI